VHLIICKLLQACVLCGDGVFESPETRCFCGGCLITESGNENRYETKQTTLTISNSLDM